MHRPSTYAAAASCRGRPARRPARAQRASAAASGAFPYPIHQGRPKGALPFSAWFTRTRQRVVRADRPRSPAAQTSSDSSRGTSTGTTTPRSPDNDVLGALTPTTSNAVLGALTPSTCNTETLPCPQLADTQAQQDSDSSSTTSEMSDATTILVDATLAPKTTDDLAVVAADLAAGHAVTGYPARLDFYPPDVYVAPKLDAERAADQQHAAPAVEVAAVLDHGGATAKVAAHPPFKIRRRARRRPDLPSEEAHAAELKRLAELGAAYRNRHNVDPEAGAPRPEGLLPLHEPQGGLLGADVAALTDHDALGRVPRHVDDDVLGRHVDSYLSNLSAIATNDMHT